MKSARAAIEALKNMKSARAAIEAAKNSKSARAAIEALKNIKSTTAATEALKNIKSATAAIGAAKNSKSARAAIEVAKNVVLFPLKRENRENDELAFLPAALEIVETPPSPIGRAIAKTIVALFCLALIWAAFGQVDIIAFASGKIVPTGRVKLIQPLETGVVRVIHVHDGQSVKAGDVLIELDPTITDAEAEHVKSDLIAAQLDVARLRAALSDSDNPESVFQPPAGASPDLIAMQRHFLLQQTEEYQDKLASLDRQREEKAAERDTTAAMIDKLEADEPIISQRVDIHKGLVDKQLGSRLTYLETLQQLTENEKDIAVEKSRLDEANATVEAIGDTRAQAAAEFHRTLFGDLAEAERKAAGLSDDLARAEQRAKLQVLTAPVDGVVQQLSVHTVGGVVTPAQQLAVVVPSDSGLEVEAMVSNRDIGFVHVGQDVNVKVDTFNFTRYGLLHGRVVSVSQDAIVRDVSPNKGKSDTDGGESASSEPEGQELSYAARVSLDRTQILVDGVLANLSPGMAVTVEIKTGSRSVISYLLSPLLRYAHDSMHER
jgi:hemolysin D